MNERIYVVGGDMRQIQLAKELENEGYRVKTLALCQEDFSVSELKNADVVILPIPASRDNVYINTPLVKERIALCEVLDALSPECYVLGACISGEVEKMLTQRGLRFEDYYEREELIIKNAIPTAEGAIEIALSEMPITLYKCRALVVGYGRVGIVTAQKLHALGTDVTVSARKLSDFAWIEETGMKYIHTNDLAVYAEGFDLIVNTVPAVVITEDVLKRVNKDALIIDLASKPGGIDMSAAKRLGVNVIWALSLPGKCAPVTSGKIIKETIVNILAPKEV